MVKSRYISLLLGTVGAITFSVRASESLWMTVLVYLFPVLMIWFGSFFSKIMGLGFRAGMARDVRKAGTQGGAVSFSGWIILALLLWATFFRKF